MRLTLTDLIGHPWLMGETATREEVQAELSRRQELNKNSAVANEAEKPEVKK